MIKGNKSYLYLFVGALAALLLSTTASAQSCDSPTSLCGGDVAAVSEYVPIDFTGSPVGMCLTRDAWSVARFHTTYLNTDDGATISLQNVDCLNTTLQAIVVWPNQLDYCDISQYTPVSDCITVT